METRESWSMRLSTELAFGLYLPNSRRNVAGGDLVDKVGGEASVEVAVGSSFWRIGGLGNA